MGRRKIGWKDQTVTGGYGGANKERRYRGVKGERHYLRITTECEEYRVHSINDVLDPKDDGEERVFNINCSKEWNEGKEDYVGECLACERDYDINTRYICGLLLLAVKKGTKGKAQIVDPENSPHYWDFGADKYRKLSNHAIELSEAEPPKSLKAVEFVVTCEDSMYQKLDINVSQGKTLTTKAHLLEWKEQGTELVEGASGVLSQTEQKRALKKKGRSSTKKKKKVAVEREDDDEEIEVGESGDDEIDDLLAGF